MLIIIKTCKEWKRYSKNVVYQMQIITNQKLNDEKNYQILIFSLNIDLKQRIRSMIFLKIRLQIEKKKFVTEKITKFDYIFDTKDFILCVVYNERINKKSFENLNIEFVILQTKKICQFLFYSKIVENGKMHKTKLLT